MGTLDEIQRLSDGEFHRLGDELLRRLEPRFRRLRTHGLNEQGVSIKGQPDSYVGETAATCVVAVCYTEQRQGWWKKVVEDVREAAAVSPVLREIVIVIPWNADRDGPKDKSIDWLSAAHVAAGEMDVCVIDGRDISRQLDSNHQDLRYEHLRIPYSRLSGPSILAGCQTASQKVVVSIKESGRYDQERYTPRNADGELYRLWQSASRHVADHDRRARPVRLIALVNDSGVGKTSLVCEFASRLGLVLPVLLIQARDLQFGTEDSLIAHVIQSIQGVLDPSVRVIEEAALCRHLAGTVPLTVILDGLDEAHDPEAVRRTVSHWLRSTLGQSSILVTTSRREFWRTCAEPSWERWMPNSVPGERSPIKVAERELAERREPAAGVRLPDKFTVDELEAAWLRADQPRQDLLTLPSEVRNELRHPFTLRVFLNLRSQGDGLPSTLTRSALLECWLNRRLDVETSTRERITRDLFQRALRVLARRVADANSGSISVDELTDVPRFDPAHPPGPVVRRLIEANILETVPGQPDRIRFAVEAVQDFYRADADIEEIRTAPATVAEAYSRLRFTTAYTRLERIGHRLANESVRDEFARQLAELDARMAAVVVRAGADRFSPEIRRMIAGKLGDLISARHRVRAALAITLLGEMGCQEAAEALATQLLPPSGIHRYLKSLGATAFVKLGYVPAAQFVYRWERFGVSSGDDDYFKELLGVFRGARPEFRIALADVALRQISSPSGSQDHAMTVIVLAYIGDVRLASHLEARLAQNDLLQGYESHALLALGTDEAGGVFARALWAVGKRLDELPNDDAHREARKKVFDTMLHLQLRSDIHYLLTPAFGPHFESLIESDNSRVSWYASDLAKRALMTPLLYPAAVAADRWGWSEFGRDQSRACVTTDTWLGWWRQASDSRLRPRLLGMLPLHPSAEVEEILIECLDISDVCASAAAELGDYGIVRSAARLRGVLAEDIASGNFSAKSAAVRALGSLRDEAAIPLLEETAKEHPDGWVVQQATLSLGVIGGQEAECALTRLLKRDRDNVSEDTIMTALLLCGSRAAVRIVIERASSKVDGPAWLILCLRRLWIVHGWRQGEYYTHIFSDDLITYLASQYPMDSLDQDRNAERALRQIDGPAVRELLREWAIRSDSANTSSGIENGPRRKSNIYYEALRDRGDESAIDYTLNEGVGDRDEFFASLAADRLISFPTAAVSERLRSRLAASTTATEAVRMLALLGRFGERGDAELAARFLDHPDDTVANVACETMLRLSDPLLVPDDWREV